MQIQIGSVLVTGEQDEYGVIGYLADAVAEALGQTGQPVGVSPSGPVYCFYHNGDSSVGIWRDELTVQTELDLTPDELARVAAALREVWEFPTHWQACPLDSCNQVCDT